MKFLYCYSRNHFHKPVNIIINQLKVIIQVQYIKLINYSLACFCFI